MVDTVLLGHPIKAGTVIFCLQMHSGWMDTETNVDRASTLDSVRSSSSKTAGRKCPPWKDDPQTYIPERWLEEVDGKRTFNPRMGSSLPFGAGSRGCFGKKLAVRSESYITFLRNGLAFIDAFLPIYFLHTLVP